MRAIAARIVLAAAMAAVVWVPSAGAQPFYADDFESYGTQADPPGWFDSSPGNPQNQAPGLYKTWPDPVAGGNVVFGKHSASNSFTHQRDVTVDAAAGFRLEGRMLRTKDKAEMGVTVLSGFPAPDAYYLLAQRSRTGPVDLTSKNAGALVGDVDSGVTMEEDVWYRFVIEAEAAGNVLALRARVWEDGTAEPADWPIEATVGAGRRTSGWIGLWGSGAGHKFWDDLAASDVEAADDEPPVIHVGENGAVLEDGALFNRTVVPTIEVADASPPVSVTATLDGAPFTSGTPVTAEGSHTIAVSAEDAVGNSAQLTVTFTIDRTPPVFLAIAPPEGSLTTAPAVTLTGRVQGAAALTVNGAAVPLGGPLGEDFSAGPLPLVEGGNPFLLSAIDAAGNEAQIVRTIVRDSTPPAVSIAQPAPGAFLGQAVVTVAGSASDPHLASVTVTGPSNSVAATLSGSSFTAAGLQLVEGGNTLTATATDAAGNSASAQVTVTVDTGAPVITVTDYGAPLPEGLLVNRTVTPVVTVTDATAVTVDIRLGGAPFTSGTPVDAEGEHTLTVHAEDAAGNTSNLARSFTIDKTPPAFGPFQPPDGTVTGDESVTLSGQVTGGAASVTVNGSPASLSGESFNSGPLPLAEGETTFTLVATDAAGNSTQRLHRIVRDSTAPVLTVAEPADGAVVGTATLTVAGTAGDPRLAEVRVNGQLANLVGDAFSLAITLTEGSNPIEVVATDSVGNSSTVTLSVTLDTGAPVIRVLESGVELVDGALFDRPATPVVEVTDATAVATEILLDGAPFVSGTTITAEGEHELSVTATDEADNAASLMVSFSIDATPPAYLSVEPPASTVLAAAEVTLTGRVRGATSVTVDGAPASLVGEDFTAGPFPLVEGERVFELRAVDAAGHETVQTHAIVRDSTAPQVTITQPAANAVLGTATVQVLGTASDPHLQSVTVNGIAAQRSGNTYVAAGVPLSAGSNTLTAIATDAAGNSAQAQRTVEVDLDGPSIAITDPAAGTVVPDATILVRGTAADPHLDRVTVNGLTAQLAGAPGGPRTWSVTVPLDEGDNQILARALDTLGRSAEATVAVRRDSTAPAVAVTTPAEGARIAAEAVEVTGTVDDEPGIEVTVNGVAATVTGGTFSAPAVPLVEGENRLIARVVDELGNRGSHTRTVIRDTVAPTFVSSAPPAGALAVPTGTVFVLTFSEELAPPAAGAIELRMAAGTPLAVSAVVSASTVRLTPAAALPPATPLELRLTAALEDLAGNPLGNPQTLTFATADTAAPPAPVLDAVPAYACAPAITLSGAAEPGVVVEVAGGQAAASVRAGPDGSFTLSVPLVPAALNRLQASAVDDTGNRSLPTLADVAHDCHGPVVVEATADGAVFTVRFSEPVEPTSVAGAITLESAAGPLAGTAAVAADGRSATFIAAGGPPAGAVRLTVSQGVTDPAGNPLAYPFSRVFGGDAGVSFVAGTVIDDGAGRPLQGARVVVLATDGIPSAEPPPEQTTGPDGRFQIPLPAGTHDLTVVRPGYTPSFRIVTTQAGQGTDVFDPRLVPAGEATSLGSQGGTYSGEAGIVLSLPPGALASPTPVAVTRLTEQGLPALLPYGWAPRGAVWVDLARQPLAAAATLTLPVDAPDGPSLTLATLDLATLQWRAVRSVPVENGRVTTTIGAEGAWAIVEADTGALAPPPAIDGQTLGSAPMPTGNEVASAELSFDPELVLPSQQALATVLYTLAEETPSGLPLTLTVAEELELLDGTFRREPPYRADLVLYRAPDGTPRSRFHLRPSEAARLLPIHVGTEDVTLSHYGDETVRGDVLGPDGGSVTSEEGDRVDLPAGALPEPAAVVLTRLTGDDLPVAVPAGADLAGVLELDLGGRLLAAPASLSLALDPPPPAGAQGLLLQVVDLGAGPFLRPVAEAVPDASGWTTAPIDPLDLAWPGVTSGGRFAFLALTSDHGFLRGTVLDVGAAPLAGALVTGIVGGADLGWIQLSAPGGGYVLPAPVGPLTAAADNPATGNRGERTALLETRDQRLDLDLPIQVVAPRVIETVPAAGAVEVPIGVNPTIRFSEPVDRASLANGVRLLTDGAPVAIDLDHQGALVTIVPQATLRPGAVYTIEVNGAVRDLQGYQLAGTFTASFATQVVLLPGDVDLSRVLLVVPGPSGEARVIGRPGAVPAETLVFVENLTSPAVTVSVEAGQDGSFELAIPATVGDVLLLHVLIEGANEVILELSVYLSEDLRTGFVDQDGGTFTTGDGVTVTVEPGTFAGPTPVRVVPAPVGVHPLPVPAAVTTAYAFDLSTGGREATRRIGLSVPAPAGAPDTDYLLLRVTESLGRPGWMPFDFLVKDGGELTNAEAFATPQGAGAPALARFLAEASGSSPLTAAAGSSTALAGAATLPDLLWPERYQCTPGMSLAGRYEVWYPATPMVLTALPFAGDLEIRWEFSNQQLVALLNSEIRDLLAFDGYCLPSLLGDPIAVEVRDLGSGDLTFSGTFDPPAEGQTIITLPPDTFDDAEPPVPVAGSPLRFHLLDLAEGAAGDLGARITYELAGSTLTVTGEPGAAGGAVQVRLLGLDDASEVFADADADGAFTASLPAQARRRYLLAIGARIATNETLTIDFSEALAEGFPGIEVRDSAGRTVGLDVQPVGSRETVAIRAEAGWRAGERYTLRLGPALADDAGNGWGEDLGLRFSVEATEVLGTYPSLTTVRDIARVGGWLFVAAEEKGLAVLDATDPANLRNVIPGGGDVTFPFPLADPVRGVTADPHGRVIVVGGGLNGFGQLKIFDPLALDPAAVAAAPNDPAVRFAAFRGSTAISDQVGAETGTQLLGGFPRHVTVLSDDDRDEWAAGGEAPAGLTVVPPTPPAEGGSYTLVVSGQATAGLPVTLRNLDRGTWNRVDAGGGGAFEVELEVAPGDRLELLRNRRSLAYVAILGAGIAVADVNATYLEAGNPSPSIQVRGYFSDRSTTCALPPADPLFLDVGGLFDAGNAHPLTVAGLLAERGVLLLESNPNDVGQITAYNEVCAEVSGSRRVLGLEVAQRYRFDFDGDGVLEEAEERDYLLVAHATAGLLVFDATDRDNVTLAGRVRIPGSAVNVALDRDGRRLFLAGSGTGVYVVDFDRPPSPQLLDANGDGTDDRVLETILLTGNTNSPPHLVPELGLAFVGGAERPLTALSIGPPRLVALAAGETGGATAGPSQAVERLAPCGVPTAPASPAEGSPSLPCAFRLLAALPGSAGPEVRLDLESLGPGGVVIDGAGYTPGLPGPSLAGSDALVLRRQSDDPKQDGYNRYLSGVVSVIADLRAARAYARTAAETAACNRCDQAAEGIPSDAAELLSGDAVAIRFADSARLALGSLYTPAKLDAAELSLASVRWETAPSLRQEPTLNADTGMGEVAPGTLLHSGEQSTAAVDLGVRGRGLDFAFARTFRNQTVGSGPLGPGWDHAYRQRLRELPTGDVEYYDGRGRRELFRLTGAVGSGAFESPPGRFATLERTAAGFVLIHPDYTRVRFDRFGRLTSIADPVRENDTTGNQVTLHYDAASRLTRVRDSLDRDYTLSYNPAGLLTELTDFDGRTVRYGYDGEGRLTSVTSPAIATGPAPYPAGLTTRYSYDPPTGNLAAQLTSRDNLISLIDARGITRLQVNYTDADGDGRAEEVTSQTWGDGTLTIAYDLDNRTTTVTDRRGHPHVCRHNAAGQKTRYEDPAGAVTSYAYDAEGLLTSLTEPLGRVTTYAYDTPCGDGGTSGARRSRGNRTEIRVAADSRGANGSSAEQVTCVEYESRTNQPVRTVDPRGTVTEIDRNAVGLPVEVREAVGAPEARATRYAYNPFGQRTSIINPNGHVTTLAYHASGPSAGYLREQVVDPGDLAIATRFETDARGNVTAVVDPRGVRHTRTYNEVDWLVEEVRAASGSADGAPALGYRTAYLHDEVGNLTELRRPFGDDGSDTTSDFYEYGTLDQLLEIRRAIGDGTFAVDKYEYDPSLNPIRHTGPEGQLTELVYEPRDLVESVTRGVGTGDAVEESFAYDLERQPTAFVDGRGNTWASLYDGYGRLMERRDPLGNRATSTFDDQHNPAEARSFDGGTGELLAEMRLEHDLLQRPTAEISRLWRYEDGTVRDLVSRSVYDRLGNLVAAIDPLGRQTTFDFDAAERLIEITDAAGNRTVHQLDAAGNPTVTTAVERTPEGGAVSVITTATFDAAQRPIAVTDPLGNVEQMIYDARDNLRFAIDAESFATEHQYDALDRRVATLQPEGVDVTYTFDRASRLTAYSDALGNTTHYTWDALDRQRSITYPDSTVRLVTYDETHNAIQLQDANGTVVGQTHDPANRLTSREVSRGDGVAGATAESYAWDGLNRLIRAQKGAVVTELGYDSLSRQIREATNGRAVTYQHDDAGNAVTIGYSSGTEIGRVFDALDRPEVIGPRLPDGTVEAAASFGFRGRNLVARTSYGNGITGTRTFDAARRPTAESKSAPGLGVPVFSEALSWSPRNLKVAQSRGDLNGAGFALAHDGLKRLVEAARPPVPTATVPNNSTPAPGALAGLPDVFGFAYDRAQNLIQRRTKDDGIAEAATLPPDASGRNRPASVDGVPLAYDANGNLIQKGDLHLEYDFRNMLVRVSDPNGEIARYEYDAFNRRTARHVGGQAHETVWAGLREIEELVDGQLASRNIFGLGLDEIVRVERDTDGDGGIDQELIPLYDHTGNLAVVTDTDGKPLERYAYTPYGEQRITVDLTPPVVEQVRSAGGELVIEISEEVATEGLAQAVAAGDFALIDTAAGEPLGIAVSQPVETGRQKRRRLIVTTTDPPAVGTEVRLSIAPAALIDFFLNSQAEPFEQTFPWPAADTILHDNTPPRVSQVLVRDGRLEVELTEEPNLAAAAAAVRVDGAEVSWTLAPDRYTLLGGDELDPGSHQVTVSTAPLDLTGRGLAQDFSATVTVVSGTESAIVFQEPDSREVGTSTVGNRFGFHGRPVDPSTGLVYIRNRYFDPELGRWTSPDPLGYIDGPSVYGFAGNDPINQSDPLGLHCRECTQQHARDVEARERGVGAREQERKEEFFHDVWQGFREENSRTLIAGLKLVANFLGDTGMRGTGEDPNYHDPGGLIFAPKDEREQREMVLIATGTALAGGRMGLRGRAPEVEVPPGIRNPVPERLARVIDADLLDDAQRLGAPGVSDVFVTAADDIAGLASSQEIAQRLTLLNYEGGLRRGPFAVVEFDAPQGVASPVFRTDPGFVGFGRTAGGAREFVVPNLRLEDLPNTAVKVVP